jgi:branched-chain amino acid transport system ATP-binding protein
MRFGDRVVLEDISLVFPDREFTGIMGPNGAGKTTSFNVLTGRYRPVAHRAPRRRGHHRCHRGHRPQGCRPVVPDDEPLQRLQRLDNALPSDSGESCARLRDAGQDASGFRRGGQGLRARAGGTRGKADVPAKNLAYGDRRALEIGIALAAAPGVRASMSRRRARPGSHSRLSDLVLSLKGTLTIIAIEHDMEFLFGLADSIAVIHWGQVIAKGTPTELRENPWVKNSNLGKLQ